jgi:hypothetical protein
MAGSEDYGYGGLYDRAIRALTRTKDWYSEQTDPNRPRKRGGKDVNLPVTPPTPTPWYESLPVPDPSQIGPEAIAKKSAQAVGDYSNKLRGQFKGSEDIGDVGEILGKDIVTGAKKVQAATPEPVRQALGHLSGVVGASSEVPGRVAGAALDWSTSTGSEQKPLSDVAWEGLKGVKSGYEKGAFGATDVGQEVLKRTGSTGNKVLDAQLLLGLGSIDALGLAPKHVGTAALGAVTGGPVSAAWLPFKDWKLARNVEGLTHKVDAVSDAKEILKKGFDLNRQSATDVVGRLGHAGYYTPEQAKEAISVGKLPVQKSNTMYSGNPSAQMPVSFEPETKVLDLRAPVPREDLDEIIAGLDPVLDKGVIDDLEFAWQDQAKYAEGPGAVTHAQVRAGEKTPAQLKAYYKTLENDPIATDAVGRLNELIARPDKVALGGVAGRAGGPVGNAPMNQPGMTRKYGAIHYTDYYGDTGYERQGSVAFDPEQALIAPPETQGTAIEPPWVKAKSYQGQQVPPGVPAGKALPPGGSPGPVTAPTVGPAPQKLNPIEQAQQWAEQNIPVEEPPKPKSWDIKPTYKGKPITTYEQGTLNELAARGGPLTKEQQKKLAIIKEYEGGYYAGEVPPPTEVAPAKTSDLGPLAPSLEEELEWFDDIYTNSDSNDIVTAWGKLTPEAQAKVKQDSPLLVSSIEDIADKVGAPPPNQWTPEELADFENPNIPAVTAPAKKVLGAKAQGSESLGVKMMQDSLKNAEAEDILITWDNLPTKDQIYVKNAMPDEYQKIMDFKAEQQADADFDFVQQGGDEAADFDWGTAGKLDVEAPPAAKTLDDIISELEHSGFSYEEAVDFAPKILAEQGLPSALPEGMAGFDDVPKPKGPVTLSASDNMKYLKENYPEVAENFAKHSGTEMGSIEKHTGEVLDQWKTQLTPEDFEGISSRYGTDVEALMNVALPLHDIGKPQALAAKDKTLQHGFTVPIMSDILKKEGFDQKDIDLATELFNHDMIGSLLQGTSKYTPEQVADQLAKKADKLGMNPSDFAKLQLAFFQADASAYPFVTQFMKQQPNGGWISGSPKVKPIEDLIAGVKSTSTGVAPADTFKLKEANPNLAGMYEKNIYTKGGQDYLFKVADPSKAHMPEMETRANKVAALGGLYDARTAVQTMDGRLGSMQPLIGNRADWPTLRNKDLTKLSSEELQEIIQHHPVDWLTSNHDAHSGQWLKTPQGIIEIDRGQAWKHFGNDKLSSSYHPNEAFGEEEPIYNQIVELWKDGKLPQLSEADVKSALGTTTSKLANNRQAVMNNIESALAKFNKSDKIPTAHSRFDTLLQDLEKFWKK